jgi:Raf kinase inhibitor-like YbhB/YbcL family protein
MTMTISSPAFPNENRIPTAYTCDGDRFLSPPLTFDGIPENTASLVLIVEDPDVPEELIPTGLFTHWVVFNIPPDATGFFEGGYVGTLGANSRNEFRYTGPCPPPEYEPSEHRYFFKLFALDVLLDLPEDASVDDVEEAMTGHLIEKAELLGRYKRVQD